MTNSLFYEFNVFGIFPKLSNVTNSKTVTGNIWLVLKLFGNLTYDLIDSKFSNSKKSTGFKEKVYFKDIFDQINKFDKN